MHVGAGAGAEGVVGQDGAAAGQQRAYARARSGCERLRSHCPRDGDLLDILVAEGALAVAVVARTALRVCLPEFGLLYLKDL